MVCFGARAIVGCPMLLLLGACGSDDASAGSNTTSDGISGANGTLGPDAPPAPLTPGAGGSAPTGPDLGSGSSGAGALPSVEGNAGLGGIDLEGDPVNGGGIGNAGSGGAGPVPSPGDCGALPAVTDYGAPGPFGDARLFANEGPGGNYTLFRPDGSLGRDGFKHPIATWGNGIATTPDQYAKTLSLIASHGFVIIACNDTQAERPCLSDGLDWLVEQNDTAGALQGKLDTTREVTIGYSWGGGAAIDTADRPNVKATVSLHGMPPRGAAAFQNMHSPLLLFTSTGDTFVSAAGYVTPNYEKSQVQTFYATLNDNGAGHLYVVDEGAAVCIGGVLGLGACETAILEQAPTIAWLRYWACGDQNAERFFFGDDCTLCTAPWTRPERKEFP